MKRKIESRVGLQAASLFESTTRVQPKQAEKIKQQPVEKKEPAETRGRPKQLPEATVKSTVTFNNSQIVWLDRLSADIRASTMAIVDRGAIIRAIITAIEKSNVDLCGASSEEQIRDIICEQLK